MQFTTPLNLQDFPEFFENCQKWQKIALSTRCGRVLKVFNFTLSVYTYEKFKIFLGSVQNFSGKKNKFWEILGNLLPKNTIF